YLKPPVSSWRSLRPTEVKAMMPPARTATAKQVSFEQDPGFRRDRTWQLPLCGNGTWMLTSEGRASTLRPRYTWVLAPPLPRTVAATLLSPAATAMHGLL